MEAVFVILALVAFVLLVGWLLFWKDDDQNDPPVSGGGSGGGQPRDSYGRFTKLK